MKAARLETAPIRERKVRAATDTFAGLGTLLRKTLDLSSAQEAPLDEELSLVRDYLAIHPERFGSRLQVRFEAAPGSRSEENRSSSPPRRPSPDPFRSSHFR